MFFMFFPAKMAKNDVVYFFMLFPHVEEKTSNPTGNMFFFPKQDFHVANPGIKMKASCVPNCHHTKQVHKVHMHRQGTREVEHFWAKKVKKSPQKKPYKHQLTSRENL